MIPGSKVKTGGVKPTPAPAAAGVRNNNGIKAQARPQMTQQALRNKRQPGSANITKPGQKPGQKPGSGQTSNLATPGTTTTNKNEATTLEARKGQYNPITGEIDTVLPDKTAPPVAQPNPYETKPDPRDENYYANKTAIESMYAAEMAALQGEQDRANVSFNEEGMLQAEYNRRRKRDMGLSRLGSGSAYTGLARQDQAENDLDYMINETRRLRGKADADAQRDLERFKLGARKDQDIRDLEIETAKQLAEDMASQAETSSGDALPGDGVPEPTPAEEKKTPKIDPTRKRIQNRIKNQTRRIQKMNERLSETKDPDKREKLQKRINAEKKRRTQTKGKIKG